MRETGGGSRKRRIRTEGRKQRRKKGKEKRNRIGRRTRRERRKSSIPAQAARFPASLLWHPVAVLLSAALLAPRLPAHEVSVMLLPTGTVSLPSFPTADGTLHLVLWLLVHLSASPPSLEAPQSQRPVSASPRGAQHRTLCLLLGALCFLPGIFFSPAVL